MAFHFISNIGWLYFAPTTLALYAAKAPPGWRGTLIGVDTLSIFVASIISGRIGGLYEVLPATQFWLIHAAIVGAGGAALLLFSRPIRRLLTGDEAAEIR